MNIFKDISTGAFMSLKSWKWILVIWSSTLFLVSLLALPLRAEMNGIMGNSMITEKLTGGINLDAFINSGSGMHVLISSFRSGFFFVLLFGLLINVFFSGGLFTVLKNSASGSGSAGFFGGSASNFWSVLLICLLVTLMLLFVSFFLIGLPVIIKARSASGMTPVVLKISGLIMMAVLPVFLLVADFARAWQVSNEKKNAFLAIAQGFKNTFSHFFSSWLVMLVFVIVQSFYTVLVFKVAGSLNPASGGGIFGMFILIQLLIIIRIFLRTWRYGYVSSRFENHIS